MTLLWFAGLGVAPTGAAGRLAALRSTDLLLIQVVLIARIPSLERAYGHADYADTEALRALSPDIAGHDVYVCGPDPWADAVLRAARQVGVPPARLHRERFAW